MSNCKEIKDYRIFTKKSEMDKAISTLCGLMHGIQIDEKINEHEMAELLNWCNVSSSFVSYSPFREIVTMIQNAASDGVITQEEYYDIMWVTDRAMDDNLYYDICTKGIQYLQGILYGLMADNQINDTEIQKLSDALTDLEYLKGTYPYDELENVLTNILQDGIVTEEEREYLTAFCAEFVDTTASLNIHKPDIDALKAKYNIGGLCALCPDIEFKDKIFCFTGASTRHTRNEIAGIITQLGGIFKNSVTKKTDYLIVGDDGNPCWAYSCYGRKVEQALSLRKEGQKIVLVHENDFWDAVADIDESLI